MAFIKPSSPHTSRPGTTGHVMRLVLLATLPGILALTLYFGWGTVSNIVFASLFAIAFEAGCLKLRNRNILFYLKDYSALVTAFLLGIALPPYSAWWLIAVGMFFAIVIAKHLYGGLGYNPFNPAMIGYVVLLISFPVEMTQWAQPTTLLADGVSTPSILDAFSYALSGTPINSIDGLTAATPLDIIKQNNSELLVDVYTNSSMFAAGQWAGAGWEWVNIAFLLSGVYLLYKKVFTWHAPVSMLLALGVMSLLFYDSGSSSSPGSPLFHLLSGATMFGAFFIITDPVSSAVSTKGRIIYGAAIGVLVFIIRAWGNYPDAMAFSVLLMNFAAPFIDYYTLPRTYGHIKANRGTQKSE